VYESPPFWKECPKKPGPEEEGREILRPRGSDSEVLAGVEAREGSISMSTSLISTSGSVKGEEGAEKSIFTRFGAKGAGNAENRPECPPNDLQKELLLVQHQAFLSQLYYG
jgi:hypothetical protein